MMPARHPATTPFRPEAGLRALVGGVLLLLIAGLSHAGKPQPQAPEPPALPAASDAAGLYLALDADLRTRLDQGQRVITFGEQRRATESHVEMLVVSIGVLHLPPGSVRSLLERVSDYPSWLTLQPSYKRVRIEGAARLVADVGSADGPKAKRSMTYDVTTSGAITTWRVLDSGTALEPGSSVAFEVAAHPNLEGASLIVHRQFGLLPPTGRMTNYLSDDDDKGQNRWWKDGSRHARRIHWAFDAGLRSPPGRDREGLYVEHYQREFDGQIPFWAEGR